MPVDILNGTQCNATETQQHIKRLGDKAGSADNGLHEAVTKSAIQELYQSEAGDLAAVAQSEPRLSVPQEVPASSTADPVVNEGADKRFVTQQQMDVSGYADAFAEIMRNIPDHIRDARNVQGVATNTAPEPPANNQSGLDQLGSDGDGSSQSSDTQQQQHVDL